MENNIKPMDFLALVETIIKGEDAATVATKIQKDAISGISTQLAVKRDHLLTLEDEVDTKNEALIVARTNAGKPITDRKSYVATLMQAKRNLLVAEKALVLHKKEIEFLEDELFIVSN
jgi:hypothetical protein